MIIKVYLLIILHASTHRVTWFQIPGKSACEQARKKTDWIEAAAEGEGVEKTWCLYAYTLNHPKY